MPGPWEEDGLLGRPPGWCAARGSLHDPVADAPFGDDVGGLRRVLLDLLPQLADEHRHHAGVPVVAVPPYGVQYLLPGEDRVRALGEQQEDVELLGGEVEPPAPGARLPGFWVDRQVPQGDCCRAARLRTPGSPFAAGLAVP